MTAPSLRRVLLVGMMGAGKSTVGRRLADELGWELLDSDAEVEKSTGRTVPQIFAESGEAAFRREEARVLAEATASDRPVVVAVAGGAVLDADNRALIKAGGLVVWLRASLSTLANRVGAGEGRPLLASGSASGPASRPAGGSASGSASGPASGPAGGSEEALARLYPERRELYSQVSDVVVDVDGAAVEETVAKVLDSLGRMSNACTS